MKGQTLTNPKFKAIKEKADKEALSAQEVADLIATVEFYRDCAALLERSHSAELRPLMQMLDGLFTEDEEKWHSVGELAAFYIKSTRAEVALPEFDDGSFHKDCRVCLATRHRAESGDISESSITSSLNE